jgi:glycosyltransferase involved in cell wall biosynthesis
MTLIERQGATAALAAERRSRAPARAIVCVPTFRRPAMLRETLRSLCDQRDAPPFAIVVVDNEPVKQEGRAVADGFLGRGELDGICVVEAEPGNCRAINRAFDEARRRFGGADYLLMIDDDEVADFDWLKRMVEAAETSGADIVGGPVEPRFPADTPDGLARHPIYWPFRDTSGPVKMIYGSGNFLIKREAFAKLADPRFDLAYNFLGGGDTDFFTRCRRAGLKFYWRQDARIEETVPRERLQTGWILRRGLRIGAINYRIERANARSYAGRLRLTMKTAAIAPLSLARAAALLTQGKPATVAVHPILIALGRICAAFGVHPEQYRARVEPRR